jgi:hypothetical protein
LKSIYDKLKRSEYISRIMIWKYFLYFVIIEIMSRFSFFSSSKKNNTFDDIKRQLNTEYNIQEEDIELER